MSAPAQAPAGLEQLVATTTEALARQVTDEGLLLDPGAAATSPAPVATPSDHYGATFAALALAARDAADPRWRALVSAWASPSSGPRGHAPFNRLALLLLTDRLRRAGPIAPPDQALLDGALQRCQVGYAYPSNNWTLLARATDVLSARLFERDERCESSARLFDTVSRPWITEVGGFIDFPYSPSGGFGATPITYHAKFVALLLLVARHGCPAARLRLVGRALRWMLVWLDGSGHLGGFGRSTHALFGDACVLFVLLHGWAGSAVPERWRGLLDVVCARLEATRRDDGLLSLTPCGVLGAEGGWDEYMHLSVYNAYAAGLLGWALCSFGEDAEAGGTARAVVPWEPGPADAGRGLGGLLDETLEATHDAGGAARVGTFVDEWASLSTCRGSAAAVCVSHEGQPVQSYTTEAVDLRYAALVPWHVTLGGRPVVSPPVRVPRRELHDRPALAGWTPLFARDEVLYGLVRTEAHGLRGDGTRLVSWGRGRPSRLHHTRPPRGGVSWWLENVDHYLSGGRRRRLRGLKPRRLQAHDVVTALVFDGEAGWWAHVVLLRGRTSDVSFLNPHGRALLSAAGDRQPLVSVRTACAGAVAPLGPDDERSVDHPSPLAGAFAVCGPRLAWPLTDTAFVTVCGHPEGEPPVRVDLEADLLVTPWDSFPLDDFA